MDDDFKFNLIDGYSLYKKKMKSLEYLVENFISEESLVYFIGHEGTFKTGLALLLAIAGAILDNFLGFKIKRPIKTLFIDEENGIRRTKHKFDRLINGLDIESKKLKEKLEGKISFSSLSSFKINVECVNQLEEVIKENNFNLVIIDNITRTFFGNEDKSDDVKHVHKLLKPLATKYNVTFIILHHTPKGRLDARGSGDFKGQADEMFMFDTYKRKGDTKIFKLLQIKQKDGLEMEPINFEVKGTRNPPTPLYVSYGGSIKENIDNQSSIDAIEIKEWWENNPEPYKKTNDIMVAMGWKINKIHNAIKKLQSMGIVKHHTKGDHYGEVEWILND